MALLGDLQFKVGLDDKNYTQGMSRMQKSTQTFNSVLDGLKTTLLGIFGTAGVMAMVRSSTKNWADQETALVKLDFAINQFAGSNQKLKKEIVDLSTEMQSLVGIGDEQVQNLAMLGLSYGIQADKILEATEASIYLSKVTGTDVDTIMRGFAQTMEGTVGILGRYIPEVRSLSEEQLKAGEAIDLINEKFEGLDETLSQTTESSLARMKASIGDLGEIMGEKLAPIVKRVSDFVVDFTTAAGESGSVLKTVADYAKTAFDNMGILGKAVTGVISAFLTLKFAATAWHLLAGALVSGGKIMVTIFHTIFSWPAAIMASVFMLQVAWEHNWFGMRDTLVSAWESMENAWNGAYENLKEIWDDPDLSFLEQVAASIGLIAGKIWKGGDGYRGLGTIWSEAWNELVKTWKDPDLSFIEQIGETFGTVANAIWESAVTIGAAFTEAFGGDVQQYLETTRKALEDIKTSWQTLIQEGVTPQLRIEAGFELAEGIYELPAKLVLSGFIVEEDFDITALDNIVNILTETLGLRLITGSWRLALGISLLTDVIFGNDISADDWKNWLYTFLASAGAGLILTKGNLLSIPIALAITEFTIAADMVEDIKEQALNIEKNMLIAPTADTSNFEKALRWALGEEATNAAADAAQQILKIAEDSSTNIFEEISLLFYSVTLQLEYHLNLWAKAIQDWWNSLSSNEWWGFLFGTGPSEEAMTEQAEEYLQRSGRIPGKQSGGFTANVGVDQVAGVVHGGEWVAPAWMVDRLPWLFNLLEAQRRQGFKTGGFVGYQAGGTVDATGGLTLAGAWEDVKETLQKDLDFLADWAENIMAEVGDRLGINTDELFSQLSESTNSVEEQFDELGQQLNDTETKLYDWQEILVENSELFQQVGDYAIGINEEFSNLATVVDWLQNTFSGLLEKTSGFTSSITTFSQPVTGFLNNFVSSGVTQILGNLVVNLSSVNALLNPFTTILDMMVTMLGPAIDTVLRPFLDFMMIIARTMAGLLAPALQLLYAALYPLIWVVTAVGWAMDQAVLAIDSLIDSIPFMSGFLSSSQRREMSRSIEQRMAGYEAGEEWTLETPEGYEGTTGGITFQAGSTQAITNNINFYFSGNTILSEDDEAAKRLAEVIVNTLREHRLTVLEEVRL